MRVTLSPIPGGAGTAKAVKRPESRAEALQVAKDKEVLGPTGNPTRLFFSDGGEIDADSWELVADKDMVYVTEGVDWHGMKAAPAAPAPQIAPVQAMQPMQIQAPANPAAQAEAIAEAVKKVYPLANAGCLLHILGFCVGHLCFFVESIRTINDTAGTTAFIMFVFIPTTGIWAMGFSGCFVMTQRAKMCCAGEGACCKGCCTDYLGRPNAGCAQVLCMIALVLHGIIAYVRGPGAHSQSQLAQRLQPPACPECLQPPGPTDRLGTVYAPPQVETFLMANIPSWIIAVLIAKNAMCIIGEALGITGGCIMAQALKPQRPVYGAQVPVAVASADAV